MSSVSVYAYLFCVFQLVVDNDNEENLYTNSEFSTLLITASHSAFQKPLLLFYLFGDLFHMTALINDSQLLIATCCSAYTFFFPLL